MHNVVVLIAEKQGGICINQSLSRLLSVMCLLSKSSYKTTIEPGVLLEAASLFQQGRGKFSKFYLPHTLLMRFTEYYDIYIFFNLE
ncbi:hypothetical protein HanIR_Chr05g0214231 [Helianthus annuus]|nr:hypothetical protein HanIR_Chr05g0214231 [Helianthus annuus]